MDTDLILLGRAEEMASVEEWLDLVPAGTTGLMLEGEAGIGKSSVLRSAIASAHGRGWRVLVAHAGQAEAGLSFTCLTDLLEPIAESALLHTLPEPQREALEIALLRRSAAERLPDPRTIGAATLSVLRAAGADVPIVLAIDDAQWLDAATRNALRFAFRRLASERIGVLVALRAIPGGSPLPLGLGPTTRRLTLGTLNDQAIRRLLQRELGTLAPGATLRRIAQISGGNPLFALELARAIRNRPDELTPGEPLPLPNRLRDVVLSRLRGLPSTYRAVLLHAAALRAPTLPLLRDALGDESSVDQAVEAAEDAGFLIRRGTDLMFAHPLFASVLYGSARTSTRRALHGRLADVVTDNEERARHLALATVDPDATTAAELEGASYQARARGAVTAAAELAVLAHRLTPADDRQAVWRRQLLAARHQMDAQDLPAAQRLLQDLSRTGASHSQAEALLLLARIAMRAHGPEESIALAEEALTILGGEDHALRARLLTLLASHLVNSKQHNRHAIETANRSIKAARSVGDQATESVAMMHSILARIMGGHAVDKADVLAMPPFDTDAPTLYFAGWARIGLGDHVGARRYLEALRERQEHLGDEFDHPPTTFLLADLEAREGNIERSLRLGEASLAECIEAGQTTMAPVAAAMIASAMTARDELPLARAVIDEWRPVAERSSLPSALAFIARADGYERLCAGDASGAVSALDGVWTLLEDIGVVEHAVFPFRTEFIEALILTGQTDRAEQVLETAEERGSAFEQFSLHCWLRCREQLAAARGHLDEAIEAGERALSLADQLPTRFEVARTRLVHGGVLRRARRKRAARELLEQARREFSSFGAAFWVGRATSELERVGVAPGSSSELTPTEIRVARLAAQGKKNRDIAAELSITVKTVEANLARIYRKLGVQNRVQLAGLTIDAIARRRTSAIDSSGEGA